MAEQSYVTREGFVTSFSVDRTPAEAFAALVDPPPPVVGGHRRSHR